MNRYVVRWRPNNNYLCSIDNSRWGKWSKNVTDAKSFGSLDEVDKYLTFSDGEKYLGSTRDLVSFDLIHPLNLIKR